jgi:hypothetical protein
VTSTTTLGGTPTGSVSFYDSRDGFLGNTTLTGGVATLMVSYLEAGNHTITAYYGGDAVYDGSTSPTLSQTVNPATTSTAPGSSPNPSLVGQTVTFTATVTSTTALGGTPTGSVSFYDDRDGFLGNTTLTSGVATLMVSSLEAGTHTITAYYSGDSIYDPSTSPPLAQTVGADADAPAPTRGGVQSSVVILGPTALLTEAGFQDESNGLSSLPSASAGDRSSFTETTANSVSRRIAAPTPSLAATGLLSGSSTVALSAPSPSVSASSASSMKESVHVVPAEMLDRYFAGTALSSSAAVAITAPIHESPVLMNWLDDAETALV